MTTVLYSETLSADDSVERAVFGPDVRVLQRDVSTLADLDEADCEAAAGLLVMRHEVTAADLSRFPRLRALVCMGVGYDRVDGAAAARRGVIVCNVPDYGTAEVADHTMALVLALRRGVLLYHDTQRGAAPGPWCPVTTPLVRRLDRQRFGIIGLGRVGTAVALRAKAFGFAVAFYDPYRPNGTERALGIDRAHTLEALLERADVLSVHAPLTGQTRGMLGIEQLRLLPEGAVVVNTARGALLDLAALEVLLREGSIAGAGLDVLPVEPPDEPVPDLLRAYRAQEPWLQGRLVVTPHAASHSPEADEDIRRKSAETMLAALLGDAPQNVIAPEGW